MRHRAPAVEAVEAVVAVTLHDDPDMEAQLQRTLIASYVGGADLGEAMATAARVPAGDYDAWHGEWAASAAAAERSADEAAARGRTAAAGRAYLRASEYHRQSYFFLRRDPTSARVRDAYGRHRDAFRWAIPHLGYVVEPIAIDARPVPLNGYVLRPPRAGDRPRPAVLFPGGFDSTCEEMLKYGAAAAVAEGYVAVTFDGPGQGGQLIEHGVTMRPDFESVLTPVVDWAVARPDVDPDAVALVGRSLGGYLGPRGASGEHRIRALVADPGQFDFTSRFVSMFSAEDWSKVVAADPAMDEQLAGFIADDRGREFFGARMAAMGAATFGDWLRMLVGYSLEGRAGQITCPTLVTEGEGDFASQSRRLYDALECEKTLHAFTAAEGAGGHCEGMGQLIWQDLVFGWLAEQLAPAVGR